MVNAALLSFLLLSGVDELKSLESLSAFVGGLQSQEILIEEGVWEKSNTPYSRAQTCLLLTDDGQHVFSLFCERQRLSDGVVDPMMIVEARQNDRPVMIAFREDMRPEWLTSMGRNETDPIRQLASKSGEEMVVLSTGTISKAVSLETGYISGIATVTFDGNPTSKFIGRFVPTKLGTLESLEGDDGYAVSGARDLHDDGYAVVEWHDGSYLLKLLGTDSAVQVEVELTREQPSQLRTVDIQKRFFLLASANVKAINIVIGRKDKPLETRTVKMPEGRTLSDSNKRLLHTRTGVLLGQINATESDPPMVFAYNWVTGQTRMFPGLYLIAGSASGEKLLLADERLDRAYLLTLK